MSQEFLHREEIDSLLTDLWEIRTEVQFLNDNNIQSSPHISCGSDQCHPLRVGGLDH